MFSGIRLCSITAVLACATVSIQASTLVFEDDFDNGVPENSNTIVGFWDIATNNGGTGGSVTYDEDVTNPGMLTVQLADTGTSAPVRPSMTMSGPTQEAFSFASKQMTYAVDLALNTTNDLTGWPDNVRFSISDESSSSFNAANALTVEVDAQGQVVLGWKNGQANSNPFATTAINNESPSLGDITRIELTLDSTGFSLTIQGTGGGDGNSKTWADTFDNYGGLTVWQDASVGLFMIETDPNQNARSYTNTLDRVEVIAVPESSSVALLLLGSLALCRRSNRS